MQFLFLGIFGAFLAILCFILGFFLGRKFPEKLSPVEPTPELKKKQDEEALPYGGAFAPNKGEIEMELVDGINVMFGNPNSSSVEKQPYILIVGRDTVANLRREAKQWRTREREAAGDSAGPVPDEIDLIRDDSEFSSMPGMGGRREITSSEDDLSAAVMNSAGPAMGGELDAAKKIANLPTAMQARYNALPKVAQRAALR